MIRNVVILTFNDLAIAFKNKTLYLILFIPLFVFVALQLVDGNEPDVQKINIGLLEKGSYPPVMIQSLQVGRSRLCGFLASERRRREAVVEGEERRRHSGPVRKDGR